MSDYVEASATLINDKVQFSGVAGVNPEIICDYVPPLGDGNGYTGLELLLTSLAACAGTAVAALLRNAGKTVSGLKVNTKGQRRDEHPTSLEKIWIEFILTSPDGTNADVEKAIQMSGQTISPVWTMLNKSAEIVTDYKIIA
jgi:putative redox protein